MGNWIKNDWGKILILIPILAILIGCGRIAFVFEFGYPLSLKERDFTVEDPTDQRELAFAFIHSVAFHKIDGIKLQVDPSQQDDLERLTAQIEPANKRCRIPFDQVLSYSSGSYLKETISIEYICPDEKNFYKFNTYILSTRLYFYEDEKGHLMIKYWCDTSKGYGAEIGLSCLIKNLRNP